MTEVVEHLRGSHSYDGALQKEKLYNNQLSQQKSLRQYQRPYTLPI